MAAAAAIGAATTKLINIAVDPLLGELLSRAKKQLHFVLHLKDEIRFLRKVLPDLKEVIWSAEVKLETAEMRRALQDFADDAEDIVDELDTRTARRRRNRAAGRRGKGSSMAPFLKVHRLIPSRLKFANRIKELYEGLERLRSDLHRRRQFVDSAEEGLRLAKKEGEGESEELLRRPITNELLGKNFRFVGREKIKEEVKSELLSEPSSEPSVILVTGMGGVGKTTLAQDIFRSPRLERHFQIKKWVCVGDELDPKAVMAKIFGRAIEDASEILAMLEGKRFLIVLDDCWSGKLKGWKDLWDPLTYAREGSKYLITSRVDISKELEPAHVKTYRLGLLSNEECWEIFECCAFPREAPFASSSGCDGTSKLREIGRQIVAQKIKGLPLAARVIGSSLRRETRVSAWKNALTGVLDDDNIISVLMWSYRRLPSHLKQCFAYLSLFPKDHEYKREEVVGIWIAQGYVQPKKNLTLEYIGKEYFDDLVGASLVQEQQVDCYYMHDLVHDLAVNASGSGHFSSDTLASENYMVTKLEFSRHLLIENDRSFDMCSGSNYIKKLRTLVNYCEHADIFKFQSMQRVRVLSVPCQEHVARINFDKMIHLRYLDLTRVYVASLPDCISRMYNLQTLLLNNQVNNFPLIAWNLPNLRRLEGRGTTRMTGIGDSASLHTISDFNLHMEGEDIEELKNLRELRGKLRINYLSHVRAPQSASKAQLDSKEYIEELMLDWGAFKESEDLVRTMSSIRNDVLESLRPHGSLGHLRIWRFMGDRFPSWMRSKHLSSLARLELFELYRVEELPLLGHLPMLEQLYVEELRAVRRIGSGFYGSEANAFPSLKSLELIRLVALEEWEDRAGFPCLECLIVDSCPALRRLPRLLQCLKRLKINWTGLEVLPEMLACIDDDDVGESDGLFCLEDLHIQDCPSLYPDEWLRRYRMPCLRKVVLENVHGCGDLVMNYSRKRLSSVNIMFIAALRSITLCNLDLVGESKEETDDHHELSIHLMGLDALEELSIADSEDKKITAGPLELRAIGCGRAPVLLEHLARIMAQDKEFAVNYVADLETNSVGDGRRRVDLRVRPREVVS